MRAHHEEATVSRGGLRARLGSLLTNAAVARLVTLTVGLATLGLMGQCLANPARASAPIAPAASSAAVLPALPSPHAPPASATSTANATGAAADRAPPSVASEGLVRAAHDRDDAGAALDRAPLVALNSATVDDLRRLPGIGPRRANAILELRAKRGGFRRLEDLMHVRGLGRASMKRLRPLVTLSTGPAPAASPVAPVAPPAPTPAPRAP
jgi:competence protein ComEA